MSPKYTLDNWATIKYIKKSKPKLFTKIWTWIENIAYAVMKFIMEKVLRRTYQDVQHDAIMQFVKFGIVGVSNTVISYLLYAGTLLILQTACLLPKTDYLFAQIVAFILSVLWSFYWNNKMVFAASVDTERIWWKALIKTYISYSCTGRHWILWLINFGLSKISRLRLYWKIKEEEVLDEWRKKKTGMDLHING